MVDVIDGVGGSVEGSCGMVGVIDAGDGSVEGSRGGDLLGLFLGISIIVFNCVAFKISNVQHD